MAEWKTTERQEVIDFFRILHGARQEQVTRLVKEVTTQLDSSAAAIARRLIGQAFEDGIYTVLMAIDGSFPDSPAVELMRSTPSGFDDFNDSPLHVLYVESRPEGPDYANH